MPAVLTSINNGQYITDLEQVVQFKGSGFGTDTGRCGVFVGSTSYEFTVSAWTDVVIYAIPPSDLPPGAFRLGWVALAGEGEPIAPLFAGEGGVLSMPNDSRNSPAPIIPSGLFSDQVVGGLWEFDAAGTGAPEGVAGRYWLRVVNGVAGDRTYQEAIRQSDGKHFERKDIADAWERVITSTDLTQNAVDDTDGRVLQVGAAGILKGYYREAHSFTYPEYSKGAGFMYVGSGPHTDAPPSMSNRPGFVFEHKREGSDLFMQEYVRAFPQTGDANGLEHFARVVNTEVGGQTTDWLKYWHSGNLTKTSGAYDDTDGRVLKLGYGGIGAPVDNTTETDCDNMTQGGSVYYHDAGTAANRPTDDPFTIEVQAFGPWPGPYGYTQRYTNISTGMTGRRHLAAGGGSWTGWVDDGGTAAALAAETGTFTPSLSASYGVTVTPGAGAVYSGSFRKINNTANVRIVINFDDAGSTPAVGNRISLTGLPTAVAQPTGDRARVGGAALYNGFSTNILALFDVLTGGGADPLLVCTYSSGAVDFADALYITMNYQTAS